MYLVIVAVEIWVVWCEEGWKWTYAIGRKLIEKSGEN